MDPQTGFLTVLEEVPGYIHYEDMTEVLVVRLRVCVAPVCSCAMIVLMVVVVLLLSMSLPLSLSVRRIPRIGPASTTHSLTTSLD